MSSDESAKSKDELLLSLEELRNTGVRIGTKVRIKEMRKFIKFIRQDGLSFLDLEKINKRIKVASRFLARFPPERVLVVSGKEFGMQPVKKFCEYTRCIPIVGRFPPGLLSNPYYKDYREADVVLVSDPKVDYKAITEASIVGIPVVAICDTDNSCAYVDLIIPGNNKGRRSLAVLFYLLAREILRVRGEIPPDGDLPESYSAFEAPLIMEGGL
ncbi:30S ribosomal protein S2 [Candidatus Bathyarchaeota archaeon ex4484_205]|nr:MAG: 30S ribosomal protein S2 [Candidatus Bathyarchaeota archaeon ex4484_205]